MSNATNVRHHNGKVGTVRDELGNLRDTVKDGVGEAADSGTRVLRAAGSVAADLATDMRDDVQERFVKQRDRLGDAIAERPFTSIAIAAGAGAAIMALAMLARRR